MSRAPNRLPLLATLIALFVAVALAGCGGGSSSASAAEPPLSDAAALGKKIFQDVSLSASGAMACSTCHDPDHAHAQSVAGPFVPGGAGLGVPGFRAVPSLRYLSFNPTFFFDGEGTPAGGFNRDGRAASLAMQAGRPFVSVHEMANASTADVVEKISRAAYADEFRRVFGATVFDNPALAFERVQFALERYQLEDPAFRPFDSKYDAFLAGRAALTDAELRGLALFASPQKGNCAACHPSARGTDGSPPLFTDFTYDNIGVPRNTAIPANADPAYFDQGLCGPDRTDLGARQDLCGAFKVPTLRNVATRKVFFHNGRFDNLIEVLTFYVQRDTAPWKWYPRLPDGTVDIFDDGPPPARANVNRTEAPYDRSEGMAPALTDAEIQDLAAFLGTLTDGYRP